MNTAFLKAYAPKARLAFMNAVKDRAANLGITHTKENGLQMMAMDIKGDAILMNGQFSLLDGQAIDAKLLKRRNALQQRLEQQGYTQVIEQIAYTWFNRFVAIRYMELHAYLDHGYRVLSHPSDKAQPEIIEHAEHADLPDLDKAEVIQLKLDGTQDEKLYRLLLIAQCNALHHAMPFLFEKIDDETELLLPNNLLHSDSLIRQLVSAIPESDWANIEIIGWLYQFYIADKKDQVIGKVVNSEDIPAATQLFTPNWIVKYLVQNSLGRQWLAVYPDSSLKATMEYYIAPAAQSPEVNAALAAITPSTLDPERLTVIDPAMGSGHILVEAYDLLKAMYLERGYSLRDIPVFILKNNLYGLDIDDRAAQLAMFALMMKARADDRKIFSRELSLNLLTLQSSKALNLPLLWQQLNVNKQNKLGTTGSLFDDTQTDLSDTLEDNDYQRFVHTLSLFEQAETVGSLIQVPAALTAYLNDLLAQSRVLSVSGDSFQRRAATVLIPFIQQACLLARRYDVVVANPPYMGSKGMNEALKAFAKKYFPDSKSDLFAMFMERGFELAKPTGFNAQVTMQSWMFLSSYQAMREKLLQERTINTMAHLGARAFAQISGEVVQTTAFVFYGQHFSGYKPVFFRLLDGNEEQKQMDLRAGKNRFDTIVQDDFKKIPSSPVAYWVSDRVRDVFNSSSSLGDVAEVRSGLTSGDKPKFVKFWSEVSINDVNFFAQQNQINSKKWFPHNDGGNVRKWFGNRYSVIDWFNNGENIKNQANSTIRNPSYFFREGITWTDVSSSFFCARKVSTGFIFENTGSMAFAKEDTKSFSLLAFMCSKVAFYLMNIMNPTLHFGVGEVSKLPFKDIENSSIEEIKQCIEIAKTDWNNYETSWDFTENPLIRQQQNTLSPTTQDTQEGLTVRPELVEGGTVKPLMLRQAQHERLNLTQHEQLNLNTLEHCFNQWQTQNRAAITEMQRLEQENNRLFIAAYGLQDELSPDVPEEQITLTRADREKDCQRLMSYAIGCMMGRYRLDKAGLIYAHAGNVDFDSLYTAQPVRPEPFGEAHENPVEGCGSTSSPRTESLTVHPELNFLADADGIVVMTNEQWFANDAAERISEFLRAVWGEKTLSENTAWLADSLGQKANETPEEAIRRYLSAQFYKDHLKTYKKRPIYWLFSSGKHKAFEALIYLHRYHEGSLARMRMEYVIPLQSRMRHQLDKLEKDIEAAVSTAQAKKAQKQQDTLTKHYTELLAFDEQLRHYADQRISLDLDDGVKVNYAKFRPLLAEVKLVTDKSGGD